MTKFVVVLAIMDMVSAKSDVNGQKEKYVFGNFELESETKKNILTLFILDQARICNFKKIDLITKSSLLILYFSSRLILQYTLSTPCTLQEEKNYFFLLL